MQLYVFRPWALCDQRQGHGKTLEFFSPFNTIQTATNGNIVF